MDYTRSSIIAVLIRVICAYFLWCAPSQFLLAKPIYLIIFKVCIISAYIFFRYTHPLPSHLSSTSSPRMNIRTYERGSLVYTVTDLRK